jgi:hypothetical protein
MICDVNAVCVCVCVWVSEWVILYTEYCAVANPHEDLSILFLVLRCVVRWLDMGVYSSRTSIAITNPLTLVQGSSALPSWLAFRVSEAFDRVQCLCHMLHSHSYLRPLWMSDVARRSVVSLDVTFRPNVYAVVNVKVLGLWCDVCHVTFGRGRTFLSRNATGRWSGRKSLLTVERPWPL